MSQRKVEYPVVTIALYGPNDKITTKIVVRIIKEEGGEPILKRWVSSRVLSDDRIKKQIREFLLEYKVKQSVITEGNIGCYHEEGKDFPVGEDCPFCPFWKGKQGSKRGKIQK